METISYGVKKKHQSIKIFPVGEDESKPRILWFFKLVQFFFEKIAIWVRNITHRKIAVILAQSWTPVTANLSQSRPYCPRRSSHPALGLFSSVQSHLFSSPIGAWTLKMPVPYSPPNVRAYTRTPYHNHSCSAVGAQITSLRSDDLVVPKLPACECEWRWRLVSPSTGCDWWATCHNESCALYSRLQGGTGVSPLLPPPFNYGEGVPLGQQLRALCLETEL